MTAKLYKYIAIIMMMFVSSSCLKEKPLTIDVKPGWYTVTGDKQVKCFYKMKGSSDWKIIFPNNQVYVVGRGDIFGKELHVKIKYFGESYFIPFSSLEFYADEIPGNKQYLGESPFQFNNPKSYLLIVIILILVAIFFTDISGLGYLAMMLALPASIIIYLNGTLNPLWMCSPSKVYMPVVFISFAIMLIIIVLMAGGLKNNLIGVLSIFYNPIFAIVSLATFGLNILAIMSIIAELVESDLWLAILALGSLAPPSWRYIGSFTDSKGREVDVYVN